ncbi:hypothetical protein SVAN01_02432 [Stagonosporopsis vannaccii]|nr:hypothetical protein SVAN01_02432 [Stagonosporopsis vannaccii]
MNTTRSTSKPRVVARLNATQLKRDTLHAHVDPNSHLLVPPGLQPYPLTRGADQMVDSITRLCHSEGPWNPHQMRSSNVDIVQNVSSYSNEDFSQYRQGIRSDIDNGSDSGYQTQPAHSVIGNEPGHGGQELPMDFMLQTGNMNIDVVQETSHSMVRMVSDQRSLSQQSSRSGRYGQRYPCTAPDCTMVSRCASEHRRHMLKHEKTFICYERDCKRAGKGFSTVNDLDRHRKSVHKIGIENSRSYQCASTGCSNRTKIWPRLDNFKQHLERMHKSEDPMDLIKRSELHGQEKFSGLQSRPVDTALLAGIGDPNSLSPNSSQVFSYQPSESFHVGSFSSASQDSPIPASVDGAFSQVGVSASIPSDSTLSSGDRPMLSLHNQSTTAQKRRRLTKALPPDTSQAAHSSRHIPQTAPLKLSTGPQTKSEQQQQVLEKLSKVVHTLGYQQEQDNSHRNASAVFSDDEWVKVSKVLAGLLKERPKSTRLRGRSIQGFGSNMQQCDFENCAFLGRPCDLKKHSKRHQKPYGCTYPKCHKRFGAKSDWKRHENSQHYQLEAFRCDLLNNADRKCGYHCCRSIQLQTHLAEKHEVTSVGQLQTIVKRCKIGKNCQGQYWCGFCGEIKVLESTRNDAWDERFNHIAFHFEKEKRSIDDWLCVEEDRTKSELRKEVDRNDFADATVLSVDADLNDDNEPVEDWSLEVEETTQDCSATRNTITDQQHPQPSTEKSQPILVRFCVSVTEARSGLANSSVSMRRWPCPLLAPRPLFRLELLTQIL